MIGDKRRIGFLGDEKKREILEGELYSGSIKNKAALLERAAELEITLKISDEAQKVRAMGEVVIGEVTSKTPFETKRKRIYATTGGYSMVELLGSTIKTVKNGTTSIVVFGNKMTKEMADKALKKHWKEKFTLKDVGEIFKLIMEEISDATPSVSPEYDLIIKHPSLNKKQARELIRETIIQDVKDLEKMRVELRDQMVKAAKGIEMASKIMEKGEVGRVQKIQGNTVEITLGKGVEARDTSWDLKAKTGELVAMEVERPELVSIGDLAVIENENLCIMRTKCDLRCKVILCRES